MFFYLNTNYKVGQYSSKGSLAALIRGCSLVFTRPLLPITPTMEDLQTKGGETSVEQLYFVHETMIDSKAFSKDK